MDVGRLGIGSDHEALHDAARGWCERNVPPAIPRGCLDDGRPELGWLWDAIVQQGWLGLAVDFGLLEAGIVLEELGRVCEPTAALPTITAAAILARLGGPAEVVDAVVAGAPAAVAWGVDPVPAPGGRLSGRLAVVPHAAAADWLLVPVEGGRVAVVAAASVTTTARPPVDPTRPVADVELRDVAPVAVLDDPDDLAGAIAARLWSADALGGASWCVETAASYACVREQFGQPIGRFQAVKHRCADMLCDVERARAAVWDSLRCTTGGDEERLAAATASALAPEAFATAAKGCVQVLGGIGFTWEHDAHLYLKRSLASRAMFPARHRSVRSVARLARAGVRRAVTVDLPPEAESVRAEIHESIGSIATQPKDQWRRLLADGGWITPHWPAPWGRDADPVTQLVIDEELKAAHIRRPHLQVGAWVLPTLIAHGSVEQQERWIGPTMRGEISWCQMFSEPGAGSDLASLTTKATKVDGGWSISGQKVWTSMAVEADFAICLARTNPTAPKHEGISAFVVDMQTPGITLRPLRELTGLAMFNEVFLDDVFVPDDCLVGEPGAGWSAARTTLANERVSMGSGSSFGLGVEMVLGLLPEDLDEADAVDVDHAGRLLVDAHALAALGARLTLRSLMSATPGSEASVRKLLGVEHDQRTQEVGLQLLGRAGAADDGDTKSWLYGFLANRCLSIAGGTSEIQRNVIAERLLGLPRDSAT